MLFDYFKSQLKHFPVLWDAIIRMRVIIFRSIKASKLIGSSNEKIFTKFYLRNKWGNTESSSGDGSTTKVTNRTRKILENVIKKYRVKSLLDIPCGDFNWMKLQDFSDCNYSGADIVRQIIKQNKKFENNNIKFFQSDLINDKLQKYDLIFCRDCLVHLSHDDVKKSINNIIRSKSKYLLTTIFIENEINERIITGMWRPLNLMKKPFLLPKPIEVFIEFKETYNRKERNKYLGLWEISKLNII